jgi:hypothetical protein
VHDIIPLYRAREQAAPKLIARRELASRFGAAEEKAPRKEEELRMRRSPCWMEGREEDAIAGLAAVKFTPRTRRAGKLRLFRVWKLFQELKQVAKTADVTAYRPVAERLRGLKFRRRL